MHRQRLLQHIFDLLFSGLSDSGKPGISKTAGELLVCILPVACCDEEDITILSLAGDLHFTN